VTHPFNKGFRRISASAVRASEKVQLSRIRRRLRAFQRAIDEVRILPVTPPKGNPKKRICRLKTHFRFSSVIDEDSDFKFFYAAGVCQGHKKRHAEERVGVDLG